MTLTRMRAIGTRLAVATAYTRLRNTTGRRLPVLLMVRNRASLRDAAQPFLKLDGPDKQEVVRP